jgi:hypothetical protein
VEILQEHQNPKTSKLFKIQLWNHSKKISWNPNLDVFIEVGPKTIGQQNLTQP